MKKNTSIDDFFAESKKNSNNSFDRITGVDDFICNFFSKDMKEVLKF